MSLWDHRRRDFVPQGFRLSQRHGFSILCAIAFAPVLSAPALAGSVKATIQVRARIVSSCRVSANSLLSALNTTQGRINCSTNSAASTAVSAAAYGESANYTLSDVPGTDGAVKILTLNF